MQSSVRAALHDKLSSKLGLSKRRIETLVYLLSAFALGRTVNLSHAACHLPGQALHASRYRRLQRFFQHVRLDQDRVARLILQMLNLHRPVPLALDRTNWRLGSKDINILVLAVVTRRFRVPLMWSFLDHRGNSDTDQRISLMQRYLAVFGASSIQWLLADREFIGARWMKFLNENNIIFAIRVREDMSIITEEGRTLPLLSLLQRATRQQGVRVLEGRLPETGTPVKIAARRLPGKQWLIIMTNTGNAKSALDAYRKRWRIECLFGDAKTRGLNLEDTRITGAQKLATLIAIVAMAMTWAYRCASLSMGRRAVPRKSHGRREKSWFRIGLDALRDALLSDPSRALAAYFPRHRPKGKRASAISGELRL